MFKRRGPHVEGVEGLGQQGHLVPELRLLLKAAASSHPSPQQALEQGQGRWRPGSAQPAFLQTSRFQNFSAHPESEWKILTIASSKGDASAFGREKGLWGLPKEGLTSQGECSPLP